LVGNMTRRLTRLSEETPQGAGQSPAIIHTDDEDLVSLTELKHLVDSLDGIRSGTVDFSLLVASTLPPEVFRDETRVAEIFDQFDFKRQGRIGPRELQTYMAPAVERTDNRLRFYVDMIAEFDLNKDGVLDREEFAAMVGGHGSGSGGTPGTDAATGTSRDSSGAAGVAASQ